MSKVRAENFTDRSGNGSPNFPFGLRSAGIVTATGGSFSGNVDIDGVTQTVNWVGGAAPTDGSGSNKFDIYTFTIFDTGSGYSVFGNQTKC